MKQSEVRASNARVVLKWAEGEGTRSAFAMPRVITAGEANLNRSKGRPGPLPFDRASALLDEIQRRSMMGIPIPANIWRVYHIECACDARMIRALILSLLRYDKLHRREDWGDFGRELVKGETPEQVEARLWKVDEEIKVRSGDPLRVGGSPVSFALRLTKAQRRAVVRVDEEWRSRISRGQKESPKRIGPRPVDVPLSVREHILGLAKKGESLREIAKTVNSYWAVKRSDSGSGGGGSITKTVVARVIREGQAAVDRMIREGAKRHELGV